MAILLHLRYVRGLEGYRALSDPAPLAIGLLGNDRITRRQMAWLGWAHIPEKKPTTSYLRRTFAKDVGKVRIGIFGCSVIEGAEVAQGEDMPALLQSLFRKRGYDHVEIINFGAGAYGLHQTFLLWEFVGRRYALDYTIVELGMHEIQRDDTFQFSDRFYESVHARYILDGDGVRLIPPLGDTEQAAADGYHRVIPSWRYLRYDSRPPSLMRALVPWANELRFNPFYYRPASSMRDEILSTYSHLLAKMGEASPRLTILTEQKMADTLKPRLPDMPMLVGDMARNRNLYFMPMKHPSPAHNRVRAEELFAYLTGKPSPIVDEVELIDGAGRIPAPKRRIGTTLSINGRPIASLAVPRQDLRTDDAWPIMKPLDELPPQVRGLLASWSNELVLIPLPFELRQDAKATLSFRGGGRRQVAVLGKFLVHGAGVRFEPSFEYIGPGWVVHITKDLLTGLRITGVAAEDISLESDGRRIAKGEAGSDGRLRLTPEFGERIYVRAVEGQSLDPALLGRAGNVELLTKARSGASRVPFLSYRVARVRLKRAAEAGPDPILSPARPARK